MIFSIRERLANHVVCSERRVYLFYVRPECKSLLALSQSEASPSHLLCKCAPLHIYGACSTFWKEVLLVCKRQLKLHNALSLKHSRLCLLLRIPKPRKETCVQNSVETVLSRFMYCRIPG